MKADVEKVTTFKIMSDLHLEFQDGREHEFTVPYDGEDALLLAGDVQSGIVLEDWFCELLAHRPVFYIMGNHEFYHHDLVYLQEDFPGFEFRVNKKAAERGYPHRLHCLQDMPVTFMDFTLFGATLWTDFDNNPIAAIQAQRCMNDYNLITREDDELTPAHIMAEHQRSLGHLKDWIEGAVKPASRLSS